MPGSVNKTQMNFVLGSTCLAAMGHLHDPGICKSAKGIVTQSNFKQIPVSLEVIDGTFSPLIGQWCDSGSLITSQTDGALIVYRELNDSSYKFR